MIFKTTATNFLSELVAVVPFNFHKNEITLKMIT